MCAWTEGYVIKRQNDALLLPTLCFPDSATGSLVENFVLNVFCPFLIVGKCT